MTLKLQEPWKITCDHFCTSMGETHGKQHDKLKLLPSLSF
jgi:hypothetical protein